MQNWWLLIPYLQKLSSPPLPAFLVNTADGISNIFNRGIADKKNIFSKNTHFYIYIQKHLENLENWKWFYAFCRVRTLVIWFAFLHLHEKKLWYSKPSRKLNFISFLSKPKTSNVSLVKYQPETLQGGITPTRVKMVELKWIWSYHPPTKLIWVLFTSSWRGIYLGICLFCSDKGSKRDFFLRILHLHYNGKRNQPR